MISGLNKKQLKRFKDLKLVSRTSYVFLIILRDLRFGCPVYTIVKVSVTRNTENRKYRNWTGYGM